MSIIYLIEKLTLFSHFKVLYVLLQREQSLLCLFILVSVNSIINLVQLIFHWFPSSRLYRVSEVRNNTVINCNTARADEEIHS